MIGAKETQKDGSCYDCGGPGIPAEPRIKFALSPIANKELVKICKLRRKLMKQCF
jgi:hypothetical protein